MLFVFYGFEPPDCGGSVFPLVELGCSHDSAVNSVEDSFADFSYLRFGGVDQPAGWFVGEVRFVVYCATAEQSTYIYRHIYYANFIVYLRWLQIFFALKSPEE